MRVLKYVLAVLLIGFAGPLHAQSVGEQRRAIAEEFEAAFVAGDDAAFAALIERYQPAEVESRAGAVARFRSVLHSSGDLTHYGIRGSSLSEDRLIAYAIREVQKEFAGLVLDYDGAALSNVRVLYLPPPDDYTPPRNSPLSDEPLSLDEAMGYIGEMMERAEAADNFSGQLLIQRGDETVLNGAYGYALRRFEVPVTQDTLLTVASVNKMLTAVAVLQLVERGDVDFDDTVYQHLGERWINETTARRITVRQLLTHTSGLGTYFNEAWAETNQTRFRAPADFIPIIHDMTPAFEPGRQYAYSNVGYLLLGAIVAEVSGESYFDYVDRQIVEPAGMTPNPCIEIDRTTRPYAAGYEPNYHGESTVEWVKAFPGRPRGGPAGGCYFTAADLARFGTALRNGVLITEETLAEATRRQTPADGPSYGYGFIAYSGEAPMATSYGHAGGFDGVSAAFWHYPRDNWTVILLANMGQAGHSSWAIDRFLSRVEE